MHTWIALFRGINVGGRNRLPMNDLTRNLESLDFRDIRHYIQSGNIVFRTARKRPDTLAKLIADTVEANHGFRPHVLVLAREQLARVIASNPFRDATKEPKSLHVFFLDAPAVEADLDAMRDIQSHNERFELTDDAFFLHAPDGIGRSKLAARAEKLLKVPATARNWRTVEKISEMAKAD